MSARWIAPVTLTNSVGQSLGTVENEGMRPQVRPCATHALWHASEAVHDTSIRGDGLVVKVRPTQNWWRWSE